jgi:ABC-type dipeptide/oligopeptide/nickel transport system ATPase component
MWEESKGPFRTIPSAPLGSDTDLEGCAFRPRCAHQDKTCASRPSLVVVGEADHEVACWRPVAEGGT